MIQSPSQTLLIVRFAKPGEYLTGIYFAYLPGERRCLDGGIGYLGWTGREVRKRIAEHREEGRILDLAYVFKRGTKPEEGQLHNILDDWRRPGESSIYKTNGRFWREVIRFNRGPRLEIVMVPPDVAVAQGGLFDGETPS